MTDKKINTDSLVGAELDELDDDFNFDDEPSMESSADVFDVPVDEPKKTTSKALLISISSVFLILLIVVGYFYVYEDDSMYSGVEQAYEEDTGVDSYTDNQDNKDYPVEYNIQDGVDSAGQDNKANVSLFDSLVANSNEELFLRLNKILTDTKDELQNDIKSQSKINVALAVEESLAVFTERVKVWDAEDEARTLEEERLQELANIQDLPSDDAINQRATIFQQQITELEEKLTNIELISASTNTDLKEIISSYKKENNNLTERMLALESRLASFSTATTPEYRPAIIKSIKDFKSYSLIGFDRQKMAVWLKDDDDNVIKVKKTSFLPEYGTVISITENGKIATELGFVKIKVAKDSITQPAK
jgi:hypothetical protein